MASLVKGTSTVEELVITVIIIGLVLIPIARSIKVALWALVAFYLATGGFDHLKSFIKINEKTSKEDVVMPNNIFNQHKKS